MVSDLRRDALLELLARLRRLDRVAEPYLPGTAVAHRSALKLIVFSHRSDLRRSLGTNRFAGVMQPSLKANRLLIGPDREGITVTAQHEYAHYLLRNRLDVGLPVWFDEGLASLLGAIEFETGHARIGELPEKRMADLFVRNRPDRSRPIDLQQVLKAEDVSGWPQQKLSRFYDWSWLLVHYLYFSGPGTGASGRAPLEAYLGERDGSITGYLGLSTAGLERALEKHLRSYRTPAKIPLPAGTIDSDAHTRCLSNLQRYLELALASTAHNPELALKLLEPHLTNHGSDAGLLVTLSRTYAALDDKPTALDYAERAMSVVAAENTTAAPDSSANGNRTSAIVNYADLLVNDCLVTADGLCRDAWQRAVPLYRTALREDPQRIDAVFGLGLSYLHSGRPGDAVNYLKVAYQRAPWASIVNFYLGESYRMIGDTRAGTYLTNARNWAPDAFWRKVAEAAIERIETTPSRR